MESPVIRDIQEFLTKFEMEYEGPPRHLPDHISAVRSELLREELREYLRAVEQGSLVDELDALVDLVYVALGNAVLHGFPFEEAWKRVHAANMQKVRGVSKRGMKFDVCKPPGWTPPNLEDLVYGDEDLTSGFEETTADEFNGDPSEDELGDRLRRG